MVSDLLTAPWTLFAIGAVPDVLRTGLVGFPDLLVAGPGFSSDQPSWLSDRFIDHMARALGLQRTGLPVRLPVLGWALWLAASLPRWVRWVRRCFSEGEAWPEKAVKAMSEQQPS